MEDVATIYTWSLNRNLDLNRASRPLLKAQSKEIVKLARPWDMPAPPFEQGLNQVLPSAQQLRTWSWHLKSNLELCAGLKEYWHKFKFRHLPRSLDELRQLIPMPELPWKVIKGAYKAFLNDRGVIYESSRTNFFRPHLAVLSAYVQFSVGQNPPLSVYEDRLGRYTVPHPINLDFDHIQAIALSEAGQHYRDTITKGFCRTVFGLLATSPTISEVFEKDIWEALQSMHLLLCYEIYSGSVGGVPESVIVTRMRSIVIFQWPIYSRMRELARHRTFKYLGDSVEIGADETPVKILIDKSPTARHESWLTLRDSTIAKLKREIQESPYWRIKDSSQWNDPHLLQSIYSYVRNLWSRILKGKVMSREWRNWGSLTEFAYVPPHLPTNETAEDMTTRPPKSSRLDMTFTKSMAHLVPLCTQAKLGAASLEKGLEISQTVHWPAMSTPFDLNRNMYNARRNSNRIFERVDAPKEYSYESLSLKSKSTTIDGVACRFQEESERLDEYLEDIVARSKDRPFPRGIKHLEQLLGTVMI